MYISNTTMEFITTFLNRETRIRPIIRIFSLNRIQFQQIMISITWSPAKQDRTLFFFGKMVRLEIVDIFFTGKLINFTTFKPGLYRHGFRCRNNRFYGIRIINSPFTRIKRPLVKTVPRISLGRNRVCRSAPGRRIPRIRQSLAMTIRSQLNTDFRL